MNCPVAKVQRPFTYIVKPDPEKCLKGEYILTTMPEVTCFNRISTKTDDFDKSADVTASIKEQFGQWVTPLQNGICIDIVPTGMNKAQGLYERLSLLGASYEDMIVVGDNINDPGYDCGIPILCDGECCFIC